MNDMFTLICLFHLIIHDDENIKQHIAGHNNNFELIANRKLSGLLK